MNTKKKSTAQIVIVAILFIILALMFACCTPQPRAMPDMGCFYYSKTHSLQVDSILVARTSGHYYMTVADKEYTLWTNDSDVLKEYREKYPDVVFVTCMDYTKNVSLHHRKIR